MSRILAPPALQKLENSMVLGEQLLGALPQPQKQKVIFIGVYGGTPPSWEETEWFDPKQWPPYREIDLSNERELNEIAFRQSVMHVVALRVAQIFPNSITLMISGDSEIVNEVIETLYAPGDTVFLAGHSFGGNVIGHVARALKKRDIPVAMMAYIESIVAGGPVPSNVRRAFNFYVPLNFSLCPAQDEMEAEDARATQVVNIAVPEPRGPFGGFCAEHRNIDSDPRVWKTIVDYLARNTFS